MFSLILGYLLFFSLYNWQYILVLLNYYTHHGIKAKKGDSNFGLFQKVWLLSSQMMGCPNNGGRMSQKAWTSFINNVFFFEEKKTLIFKSSHQCHSLTSIMLNITNFLLWWNQINPLFRSFGVLHHLLNGKKICWRN